MNDKKTVNTEVKLKIGLFWTISAYKPKTPVPAKAGIDIKNDIFAASSLLKLKNLAAVIIIPDLLTPGIKAMTWKKPIIMAASATAMVIRVAKKSSSPQPVSP